MEKKYSKQIFMIVLILTLILGSTVSAFAGSTGYFYDKTIPYPGFSDVPSGAWYAEHVKGSYEVGLINGYANGKFLPKGNITLAEVIKIAAVMKATYDNDAVPTNSDFGNWYDNYVSYAEEKGIIKEGEFPYYESYAKRGEMAYILSRVFPEYEYDGNGNVSSLPDVKPSTKYSENIFMLYKGGILTGDDATGTFRPEANITRAEVTAIVRRILNPTVRTPFGYKEEILELIVRTEAETITYIRDCINSVGEDGFAGGNLDEVQKQVLENIKADPKNCYPEFNSVGNFEYTRQGCSITFYFWFMDNVLFCRGDIDNYDVGLY
ncbi:MAG: S-layer homology domain-containing protein [Eubacteriales bacterium]|nr:S-layer homology domain-containing protein [Eubacteriales bacterium]